MQDASSERDEEFAFHVNRLLQIPGYIPVWGVADNTSQTPGASTSAQAAPSTGYVHESFLCISHNEHCPACPVPVSQPRNSSLSCAP